MLMVWVPLRYGMPACGGGFTEGMAGTGGQRCAVHGNDDAAVELGMTQVPASQAGVLLNMEPLMGSLLGFWCWGSGWGKCMGWWRTHSCRSRDVDDASKTRVREQMPLT